ncbi:translation initiation factor eIF-1A [Candidatus Woesearchaeota archaeon]|nr:translation initiation factor eIF-1A [Candidatus Woesearchaeota archaeon]
MAKPKRYPKKRKPAMSDADRIQSEISRIKLPWKGQSFGIVEQRLGGSRMRVRCLDSKTRICRIPGRLKRSLWVREGNIVIVQPWELGGDQKGDIVYKYTNAQVSYLKRKDHLKALEETDEF